VQSDRIIEAAIA